VSPRSQRLRIASRCWRISLRVRSAGIGWRVIEVIMRLALILGRRHPELVVLKELPVLDMGTARRMLGMYGARTDVWRHHRTHHRV